MALKNAGFATSEPLLNKTERFTRYTYLPLHLKRELKLVANLGRIQKLSGIFTFQWLATELVMCMSRRKGSQFADSNLGAKP